MLKYTKGEWRVEHLKVPTARAFSIGISTEEYDVCTYPLGIRNKDDAQLISAAPDMYEALKEMVRHPKIEAETSGSWIICERITERLEKAERALAKAEGKANDR
jgi:hypothetical protein